MNIKTCFILQPVGVFLKNCHISFVMKNVMTINQHAYGSASLPQIKTYPLFHEILLLLLLYDTRGGVWSHRIDLVERLQIRIPQTTATLYKLSHQPHPQPIRTYPLFHEILLLLLLLYDTRGGVWSHRVDLVERFHIRIPQTTATLYELSYQPHPHPSEPTLCFIRFCCCCCCCCCMTLVVA